MRGTTAAGGESSALSLWMHDQNRLGRRPLARHSREFSSRAARLYDLSICARDVAPSIRGLPAAAAHACLQPERVGVLLLLHGPGGDVDGCLENPPSALQFSASHSASSHSHEQSREARGLRDGAGAGGSGRRRRRRKPDTRRGAIDCCAPVSLLYTCTLLESRECYECSLAPSP